MKFSLFAFLFTCFVIEVSNANVVDDVVSSVPEFFTWMKEHVLDVVGIADAVSAPEFFTWMEEHSKMYDTNEETKLRLGIWKGNNAFIEAHNTQQPPSSYTLGHNHFSDLTVDEYQELNKLGDYSPGIMTASRPKSYAADDAVTATKLRRTLLQDVPDSVDWVEQGAIVPVKNQGRLRESGLKFNNKGDGGDIDDSYKKKKKRKSPSEKQRFKEERMAKRNKNKERGGRERGGGGRMRYNDDDDDFMPGSGGGGSKQKWKEERKQRRNERQKLSRSEKEAKRSARKEEREAKRVERQRKRKERQDQEGEEL